MLLVFGMLLTARAALAEESDVIAYPAESPSVTPAEYPTETPGSVKIESSTQSPITVETKEPDGATVGDEGKFLLQYKQNLKITGFRVSGTKDKAVKLSWDWNSYATGYQIYRAVSKVGSYRLVKMVDQTCTDYVDTGIVSKKKYFYKIKAIGVFGGTLLEGEESRTRSYYNAGIFTPRISVKKGRSGAVRYILVELRYYEENRVEIYISQNTKKFKKLKLVSNKISRYKGRFKIKYTVKSQNIRFKVRTYKQVGKRRIYSKFSKEVKVRV